MKIDLLLAFIIAQSQQLQKQWKAERRKCLMALKKNEVDEGWK